MPNETSFLFSKFLSNKIFKKPETTTTIIPDSDYETQFLGSIQFKKFFFERLQY
jgi:hypothetical protein